jgi:hypothetical protein
MSHEPIEPLDPQLDALLESERSVEPPAGTLERIWGRIAAVSPPTEGSSERGGPPPRSPGLSSQALRALAASFVLGAGLGALGYAASLEPNHERIVYVERAPSDSTSTPKPTLAPSSTSSTPAPSSVPEHPPTPTTTMPATSASSSSLSAERTLIAAARGELATGNAAKALSLLDEHARRFPRAQLGEEREALVVQALVASGRYAEARAAAARLRAASPGSLFLPAIDATLESIP